MKWVLDHEYCWGNGLYCPCFVNSFVFACLLGSYFCLNIWPNLTTVEKVPPPPLTPLPFLDMEEREPRAHLFRGKGEERGYWFISTNSITLAFRLRKTLKGLIRNIYGLARLGSCCMAFPKGFRVYGNFFDWNIQALLMLQIVEHSPRGLWNERRRMLTRLCNGRAVSQFRKLSFSSYLLF